MWKNKHVIVALLVAPILAIIAYFAVDYFVAERPHAAKPGADYSLVARSNCRRAGGSCDLFNGEFKVTVSALPVGSTAVTLSVLSKFPLIAATIGIAPGPGEASSPIRLAPDDDDHHSWTTQISWPPTEQATLQIAVVAGQSRYFAEVPTIFLLAEAPAKSR